MTQADKTGDELMREEFEAWADANRHNDESGDMWLAWKAARSKYQPLSHRVILNGWDKAYSISGVAGFNSGVMFAEKMHGIFAPKFAHKDSYLPASTERKT